MNVYSDHGVLVVVLAERDLKDPVTLNETFEEMVVRQGRRKILVDLSPVETMNSLMIGAIVGLHIIAYENVAVLKFTGLSEHLKMLFRLLGVDKLLELHYGKEAAVESFGPAPEPDA